MLVTAHQIIRNDFSPFIDIQGFAFASAASLSSLPVSSCQMFSALLWKLLKTKPTLASTSPACIQPYTSLSAQSFLPKAQTPTALSWTREKDTETAGHFRKSSSCYWSPMALIIIDNNIQIIGKTTKFKTQVTLLLNYDIIFALNMKYTLRTISWDTYSLHFYWNL